MTDIDDRISTALDADDRAFLAELEGDRGLFRQMGDSMQGALGGWAKLIFAVLLLMTGVLFWCLYNLIVSPSMDERILWAIASLAVLMAQGFAKDWFFSRMNMLTVLREVKRLQLQLAMLGEKR